jgi:hypothetical protein
MRNRPVLTGNVPPLMPAFDSNASTHNIKTERVLVVPVDFAIRRPDPTGPGRPCQDKLCWVRGMLDGCVATLRRRGVELPPPMVVADS